AERFALCQTLPLDQLDAAVKGLRRSGYRLLCCRPYPVGPRVQVAAVWIRDGAEGELVCGASAGEVRQRGPDLQKQGYLPVDLAGYTVDPGKPEHYAAVWVKPRDVKDSARLFAGVTDERRNDDAALKQEGFVCVRLQQTVGHQGQIQYSSVWQKKSGARRSAWKVDQRDYARLRRHLSLNFRQ